MYKIIKHERIGGLEELWKNLYNKNPNLSCYQEFEFNRTIRKYSRFSLGRYVLKSVFYELIGPGNATRMILPLYIRRKNGINEIHFLGNLHGQGIWILFMQWILHTANLNGLLKLWQEMWEKPGII